MNDRRKRWARLLPDYRTLYLSLDEMDEHRQPGESDAQLLLRSVRYAQEVVDEDGRRRLLALDLVHRAGVPPDDPLGLELAMALVARARFLAEHSHLLTTDPEPEPTEA